MLKYLSMTDEEKSAIRLKPMSNKEKEALRMLDEEDSWLLTAILMAESRELV